MDQDLFESVDIRLLKKSRNVLQLFYSNDIKQKALTAFMP